MEEWKEYSIGDICSSVCSGGTPSCKHSEYYDGIISWLNTKEINFNRIYSTEKFITEEGLNNSSAKWIKENAVIVAMYGATAGKTAIAKIPLTTNQACCNLSINPKFADYRFVFYYLCNKFVELWKSRDIFFTFYRSFFTRNPFFCAKTFSLRNKSDFFYLFHHYLKK